jgi:HSP20 family protein
MFANDFDAAFAEMDALARAFWGRGFDGRHGLRHATSHVPEFVADESGWTLHADLPGVSENDLELTFEKGVLTVKATRAAAQGDEEWTLKHRECEATVMHHRFRMPELADVENIDATLENGVLALFVPRKEEAAPRRISVRSV